MEIILSTNRELCKRLESLEQGSLLHGGIASIRSTATDRGDADTIRPVQIVDDAVKTPDPIGVSRHHFAFEGILEATRVYKRSQAKDCDVSFRSSLARSRAVSQLSGLSLADVSIISVFALPVYAKELSGDYWHTESSSQEARTNAGLLSQPDGPLSAPLLAVEDQSRKTPNSSREGIQSQAVKFSKPTLLGNKASRSFEDHIENIVKCNDCLRLLADAKTSDYGEGLLAIQPLEYRLLVEDGYTNFHAHCNNCRLCRSLQDTSNSILLSNGDVLCKDCEYSRGLCENKVLSGVITDSGRAYCALCFKCRECWRRISPFGSSGSYAYMRTSYGISCMNCHNKKLGTPAKYKDLLGIRDGYKTVQLESYTYVQEMAMPLTIT